MRKRVPGVLRSQPTDDAKKAKETESARKKNSNSFAALAFLLLGFATARARADAVHRRRFIAVRTD
jgi:hypothetical protein